MHTVVWLLFSAHQTLWRWDITLRGAPVGFRLIGGGLGIASTGYSYTLFCFEIIFRNINEVIWFVLVSSFFDTRWNALLLIFSPRGVRRHEFHQQASRRRHHRFGAGQVLSAPPSAFLTLVQTISHQLRIQCENVWWSSQRLSSHCRSNLTKHQIISIWRKEVIDSKSYLVMIYFYGRCSISKLLLGPVFAGVAWQEVTEVYPAQTKIFSYGFWSGIIATLPAICRRIRREIPH